MKFSHTEEKGEDRDVDVLTDEENGLRIIVSRLGAELISLARINEAGRWTGFLYRDNDLSAPSRGWANHATVMGYYLHPLKVGVDLTYSIDNDRLTVFFEFRNHEPELTAHVAFGLHPGFGATSFESFHLQMPRGCYRRYSSPGNYLSGETRDIEFPGGEMPFSKNELPGSIILELVD